MQKVITFSFITLLACCKHPVIPDPGPDPAKLREVTFTVREDRNPQVSPNSMKIEIGELDTLWACPVGTHNLKLKGLLEDTIRFYADRSSPNSNSIKITRISVEKNDTVEWSKFLDPNQYYPDTLQTVILK